MIVVAVAQDDGVESPKHIAQPESLGVCHEALARPRVEQDASPVSQNEQRQSVLAHQTVIARGFVFNEGKDFHDRAGMGKNLRRRGHIPARPATARNS